MGRLILPAVFNGRNSSKSTGGGVMKDPTIGLDGTRQYEDATSLIMLRE